MRPVISRSRLFAREDLGRQATNLPSARVLVFEAYRQLLAFEILLTRQHFALIRNRVRCFPLGRTTDSPNALERICTAVDVASACYWKQILCLQRSTATACLLKKHGFWAQVIIGTALLPFKAHAWVEIDRQVINDKPYVQDIYQVIDRF